MASQMEWSHDFCLFCDRQISGGAYCSQACRVGDLEKAGTPAPVSPLSSSRSSATSTWAAATVRPGGFYLPPPVNFAAYRSTSTRAESSPSSPRHRPSDHHSYLPSHSASSLSTSSSKRDLTPSSSRASLSSLTNSALANQILSDQAACQLRGYSDCFDQVREMKRRLTLA